MSEVARCLRMVVGASCKATNAWQFVSHDVQKINLRATTHDWRKLSGGWAPKPGLGGHAFTLVELMAVMAMMAVLAALLLPALVNAKRKGKQNACLGNLKEMCLANVLYAGDNNGGLMQPPAQANPGPYGLKSEWVGKMLDYFSRATNVILCPAAENALAPGQLSANGLVAVGGAGPGGPGGGQPGTAGNAYLIYLGLNSPLGWDLAGSYAYNAWFYSSNGVDAASVESAYGIPDSEWIYQKDTQMQSPSQTPVYADGNWEDACPAETDAPCQDLWRGSDWLHQKVGHEMGRIAIQRHGSVSTTARNYAMSWSTAPPPGAVNITLYDGHAELSKLPNLWTYSWHRGWGQKMKPVIGLPTPYP